MPDAVTTDVDSSAVQRFKERFKSRSGTGSDDAVKKFKERFQARQPKKEEPSILSQIGEKIESLIPDRPKPKVMPSQKEVTVTAKAGPPITTEDLTYPPDFEKNLTGLKTERQAIESAKTQLGEKPSKEQVDAFNARVKKYNDTITHPDFKRNLSAYSLSQQLKQIPQAPSIGEDYTGPITGYYGGKPAPATIGAEGKAIRTTPEVTIDEGPIKGVEKFKKPFQYIAQEAGNHPLIKQIASYLDIPAENIVGGIAGATQEYAEATQAQQPVEAGAKALHALISAPLSATIGGTGVGLAYSAGQKFLKEQAQGAEKPIEEALSPFTTAVQPTTATGKALTSIGDVAFQWLVFGAGHELFRGKGVEISESVKDAARKTLSEEIKKRYSSKQLFDIYRRQSNAASGQGPGITPEEQQIVSAIDDAFKTPAKAIHRGVETTTTEFHPLTPKWLRDVIGGEKPDQIRILGEVEKTAPTTAQIIRGKLASGQDLTPGEKNVMASAEKKVKLASEMTEEEFKAEQIRRQEAGRERLRQHPDYEKAKAITDRAGMRIDGIETEPSGKTRVRFTDDKGTYHTRSLLLDDLTPENMKKEIAKASAGRKLASEMTPEEKQKHFDEQRETNLRRAAQNPLFEPARQMIEGLGGKATGIWTDADGVIRIEFKGETGGNTSLPLEGLTPEIAKAELDKFRKEPIQTQPVTPPPGTPLEEITAPVPSEEQIYDIPINKIKVDVKRFQPRVGADPITGVVDEDLQIERAKGFDRTVFRKNPSVVWNDPNDPPDVYTILAGHHRRDLAEKVGEKNLPVLIFKGTEAQAIHYAHNDNPRHQAETALDRANYTRNQRLKGVPEQEIRKELKSQVGEKGVHHVVALSYLNPSGKTVAAMKNLTDTQSVGIARVMGEWIGDARRTWSELTDSHENELFDYLKEQYGKKGARIKTEFIDRIGRTVDELGTFDPSKPLNIKQLSIRSNLEEQVLDRVKQAEAAVVDAQEKHDLKLHSLQKTRAIISPEIIDRVMKPYRDAVTIATNDLIRLKQNQADDLREIQQSEQDLFSQENITNAQLARTESRTTAETENAESAAASLEHQIESAENLGTSAEQEKRAEDIAKRTQTEIDKLTGEAPPKISSLDDPAIQKLPPKNKEDLDSSINGLDGLFIDPDQPPQVAEPTAGYLKPSTDEITYQKAKWHFDKSVNALKITGASETDVASILVDRYGEKIRPYVQRYLKDVEDEHDFRRGQALFGATGRTGSFRRPSFRMVNAGDIPTPKETVPLGKYAIDEQQRYASNLAIQRFETPGTGFGLFDGTGFGKTRQILVIASEHANRSGKRALIIVPNKQVLAINFADDMRALNIDPRNLELGTYDDLRTKKIGQGDYSLAVFDEGHKLKNPHSQRAIASTLVKADNFLYSTATPMDGLGAASYFMSKITGIPEEQVQQQLGYKIVEVMDRNTSQPRRFVEFLPGHSWEDVTDAIIRMRDQSIRSGAMIRREYPFYGTVGTHPVTLNSQDLAEQQQIDNYWQQRIAYARTPRAKMNVAGERIQELSRWVERLKAPPIIEAAMKDMQEGRSVVILGQQYSDTAIKGLGGKVVQGIITIIADELKKRGIPFAQIYGGGDKSKAVNDFQNNKVKIAIATPESGGTGINLDDVTGTAPRTMYIATDHFSGDVFDQIMGRVSRRNTQTPVALKHVRSAESLSDVRRGAILDRKLGVLKRIQTGEDPDRVSLEASEELQKLFGEGKVGEPGQEFTAEGTRSIKHGTDEQKYQSAHQLNLFQQPKEKPTAYRDLTSGEESHVRRTYEAYKQIKFYTRSLRIGSHQEAAYVFMPLEKANQENTLVILGREGQKPIIQHLTTGDFAATDISPRLILDLVNRYGANEVWFGHNHPSGGLAASSADLSMYGKLKASMPKGVILHPGIIIDKENGTYAVFDERTTTETSRVEVGKEKGIPLKALTFSKSVYSKPLSELSQIGEHNAAAQFLTAARYTTGEKVQLLSLDHQMRLVGKWLLTSSASDPKALADEASVLIIRSGGNGGVFGVNKDLISDRKFTFQMLVARQLMDKAALRIYDVVGLQPSAEVRRVAEGLRKEGVEEPSGLYRRTKKFPEDVRREIAQTNLKNALDQTGLAKEDVDAIVRRIVRNPEFAQRDMETIQGLLGSQGRVLVENYQKAIQKQKDAQARASEEYQRQQKGVQEPSSEYKPNPIVNETKGDPLNPETQKVDAFVSLPKQTVNRIGRDIPKFEELSGIFNDFVGKTLPRITRADNRAGDLGARWANSWQTGQFISDDFGDRVLATGVDDKLLGAVLTEDRLRGIKDRNQQEITALTEKRDAETDLSKRADMTQDIANLQDEIDNIKSVVGAENSPLATEEDFQKAINDPIVQSALDIIKRDIEPWQEEKFRKAAYIPDDEELPKRGKHLSTSMSLFPVDPNDQSIDKSAVIRWGQGPGANLPASLRRRTLLARRAKGTAEQYSISFRDMLRNQIAKTLSIANKKDFEDRLIETGDAKISRPGQKIDLKGEPAQEFALKRGKINQSLYVRKGLANEYWRLENRDKRFNLGIARHVVQLFNQAALTSILEPAAHGINLMSIMLSKPGIGADAVRAKLTSVGGLPDVVTAVERFLNKSIDSPEAKKRLAELSDMGVSFRSPHEVMNPYLRLTGKQIHKLDLKVRLMLDDAFQYLVDKGIAEDTPTNRREFINQVGVYNRNVYGPVNRFFKDTGLSPFITATRAFTVSSIRNIGLQPGMKATSAGAAAKLRLTMLTKIIGTVGTIALLNYLTTKEKNGGAGGRPGTPLLTWDTGFDYKDGSHITIDVGRFFGLSRGLRSLGAKGYIEARMKGLTEGEAINAATRDMKLSGLQMTVGPAVKAGSLALSGYPEPFGEAMGLPRTSPIVAPGQSQDVQNIKTALTESNPVISFLLSPKVQTDETAIKQTLPFVGGSPAEQKIRNYPRAVHGAEFNKFLDDVATNSRRVPRQNRMKYIQKRLEDLEPADRARAMHELLLRRRVLLAK